jgi:hypothetical protein
VSGLNFPNSPNSHWKQMKKMELVASACQWGPLQNRHEL